MAFSSKNRQVCLNAGCWSKKYVDQKVRGSKNKKNNIFTNFRTYFLSKKVCTPEKKTSLYQILNPE